MSFFRSPISNKTLRVCMALSVLGLVATRVALAAKTRTVSSSQMYLIAQKSGSGVNTTAGITSSASSESKHAKDILTAARASVGKEMWKGFGLGNGSLGCAASVSNVLKKAGVSYAYSPVTKSVRQKLLAGPIKTSEFVVKSGGEKPINDDTLSSVAKPGDVLVAFMDPLPGGNIGPKAHCGIIGPDNTVFTNDWNDGIWKHASIHTYFDSYRHIRFIRLR
ncbi:MAG: hypothetical protein SGJ27_31210 [Candidatus Melainabacteria bacterium]|nr:hypothetical protein [Candidatus Melainabacteria bacterium]